MAVDQRDVPAGRHLALRSPAEPNLVATRRFDLHLQRFPARHLGVPGTDHHRGQLRLREAGDRLKQRTPRSPRAIRRREAEYQRKRREHTEPEKALAATTAELSADVAGHLARCRRTQPRGKLRLRMPKQPR